MSEKEPNKEEKADSEETVDKEVTAVTIGKTDSDGRKGG